MAIHPKEKKEDRYITMGADNHKVQCVASSIPIRFLGVWVRAMKNHSHNYKLAKSIVSSTIFSLSNKQMTAAHIVYINNRVIIPKLQYVLMITSLKESACSKLQRPLICLLKRKFSLPLNTDTTIIGHPGFIGLKFLYANLIESHVSDFVKRLNSRNLDGSTTILRLKAIQAANLCPEPIFNAIRKQEFAFHTTMHTNFNFECLIIAANMNITIQTPTHITESFTIQGSGPTLHEWIFIMASTLNFPKADKQKWLSTALKSAGLRRWFHLNNILTHDLSEVEQWSTLNKLYGFQCRGRVPLWFQLTRAIYNADTTPLSQQSNPNGPQVMLTPPKRDRRKFEFVGLPKGSSSALYGQIYKKLPGDQSALVTHWLPINNSDRLLSRCPGCSINDRTRKPKRTSSHSWPKCVFEAPTAKLFTIPKLKPAPTFNNNALQDLQPARTSEIPLSYYTARQTSTANLISTNESSLTSLIPLQSPTTEYMKKFVKEPHLRSTLMAFIQDNERTCPTDHLFKFFTDGSLHKAESSTTMGAGWTDVSESQQFSCRIINWPSSTRAELAAIWSALLTVPYDHPVVIYTDSQAAIDGIREILAKRSSSFAWFNTSNPTLKLLIKDCITTKRLKLTLIKVKGHSNDHLNDLADTLAKHGRINGHILNLDFNTNSLDFNIDFISFRAHWNGIPIEHHLRATIKSLNNATIESLWTTSRGVRDSLFLAGRRINCNFTWASLKHLTHHRCISFQHNTLWTFNLKLINNMLPFAALLQERFGDTFANWSCPLCNFEDDCLLHLITCPKLTEIWNEVIADITNSVGKFFKKHDLTVNGQEFMNTILPRTNDHLHFIQDNFSNWLKGFIDSSTLSQVFHFTKSMALATTLTLKIVVKLQSLFRSNIWSRRCISQKEKEASKGINLHSLIKAKRSKASNSTSPQVLAISLSQQIDSNEPIVLDDIDGSTQGILKQPTKIDRIGWGQDLLGIGMANWMSKGTRDWWMVCKNGSIMVKGGRIKNNQLMRAVYDQGCHRSETRGPQ
jgi:ribonuclease HI